jgi:hypothetical protein
MENVVIVVSDVVAVVEVFPAVDVLLYRFASATLASSSSWF